MSRKNQDISARRRKKQDKGLPWAYIIPAIIVIIVIVAAAYVETKSGTAATSSYILPPTVSSSSYPFKCLGSESLFLHIHPYLRIIINGHNVPIPGAIGIQNAVPAGQGNFGETYSGGSNSCYEPVHTHDFSGIIHIESPQNVNYTLEQFFTVWAQTYSYAIVNGTEHKSIVFNSGDILGFTTNSTYHLVLLVDGHPSNAYGSLVLNTLDYCTASETAASSPCSSTAAGDPAWNGQTGDYPFGTGHTIVIEYGPTSQVG